MLPVSINGLQVPDSIPLLDLSKQISALEGELVEAAARVIKSGHYILGDEVAEFEKDVASFLGVGYAVGVNSGTDALLISLRSLGIGAGDEVITTPFTFFATAEAIGHLGASPVFIDIDPVTFNLDPTLVEPAITSQTKAILPVHLFGQPAAMPDLQEVARIHSLPIIEDAAQAFGATAGEARVGSIGRLSAFSFFPSKNLGAIGDAGLVATNDGQLAATIHMLRQHGSKRKYHNEMYGYNSRLDALQAAVLRIKLPHVVEWNAARRRAAERYTSELQELSGVTCPMPASGTEHVFHQYTIRIKGDRRDSVQTALHEAGIASVVYYPRPLYDFPLYDDLTVRLPETERACSEVLSLPIWPEITSGEQQRVTATIKAALRMPS